MAEEEVAVRLTLKEQARFRQGMKGASREVDNLGGAAKRASVAMRGELGRSASQVFRTVKYGAIAAGAGITAFTASSLVSGIKLNAQWQDLNASFTTLLGSQKEGQQFVESMRGLTDLTPYRLTEALDAARGLIGAGMAPGGVKDTLEAVKNAAMLGGGNPSETFARMAEILGVVQARGRITAEELRRFDALGVPIRKGLQKELGLTADQVANIGEHGISSRRVMKALNRYFTTGNMAKAAKNMENNFSVQIQTLTKGWEQIQRLGTEGLFKGLNEDLMPALLKTSNRITKLADNEDLTIKQKVEMSWSAAKTNLGPVIEDIRQQIDDADLPQKFVDAVEWAAPKLFEAGKDLGWEAMKAFWQGFKNAPWWGKGITAVWLAKKTGLLAAGASVGKDLTKALWESFRGGKGGKAAGLLGGRGSTPGNPLFVTQVGAPKGGGKTPLPIIPFAKKWASKLKAAAPKLLKRAPFPVALASELAFADTAGLTPEEERKALAQARKNAANNGRRAIRRPDGSVLYQQMQGHKGWVTTRRLEPQVNVQIEPLPMVIKLPNGRVIGELTAEMTSRVKERSR